MNSGMVLIIFSDVDAFLVDVQFCKVEVVTIAMALNFKDEIVRSTDVKRAQAVWSSMIVKGLRLCVMRGSFRSSFRCWRNGDATIDPAQG